MKAIDTETLKNGNANNGSQNSNMHTQSNQPKVGKDPQREGKQQYVQGATSLTNQPPFGPPPGRTASAPPRTVGGSGIQHEGVQHNAQPSFFPYPPGGTQNMPYLQQQLYFQNQYLMQGEGTAPRASSSSNQSIPSAQQGQIGGHTKPAQARSGQYTSKVGSQASVQAQNKVPPRANGQPGVAAVPNFFPGQNFPRPMALGYPPMFQPPQMSFPMYQNPYVPQTARPTQTTVTQPPRQKKILEIRDPRTNDVITPSPLKSSKPTASTLSAEAGSEDGQQDGIDRSRATSVKQVEKKSPVHDARAELLASAKAALERDQAEKEKIKHEQNVAMQQQRVGPQTYIPNANLTSRETDERKSREDEAAKKMLEKQMEAQAMKEQAEQEARVKERKMRELEAKQRMEDMKLKKKQAMENLDMKNIEPEVQIPRSKQHDAENATFTGDKVRQSEGEQERTIAATKNERPLMNDKHPESIEEKKMEQEKRRYTIEVLMNFKARYTDVPASLSPDVIDMKNIITDKSIGRGQFAGSSPRDMRLARQAQQQSSQRQSGTHWARGRSQPNNGRTDPRGGRAQMQRQASGLKVEALKQSENAWKPRKAKSDDEASLRQITQILNKLSREKFDRLTKSILEVKLNSLSMLENLIKAIRNKALTEPKFGDIYADLCKLLVDKTGENGYNSWDFIKIVEDDNKFFWTTSKDAEDEDYLRGPYDTRELAEKTATKSSELRRILLNQCQEEFLKENHYEEMNKKKADLLKKLELMTSDEEKREIEGEIAEISYQISRIKARILGNIQFIGELFKKGILTERVLVHCVSHLIGRDDEEDAEESLPDEENIECLCKLLATVGHEFKARKQNKPFLDNLFCILEGYSEHKGFDARHRFMIKDVLDLRKNGWQSRREEQKAKTLEEIRKDAEKEEAEKLKAAASLPPVQQRGGKFGRTQKTGRGRPGEVMGTVAFKTNMSMGSGYKIGAGNKTPITSSIPTSSSQDARLQSQRPLQPRSMLSRNGSSSGGSLQEKLPVRAPSRSGASTAIGGRPGGLSTSIRGGFRPGGPGNSSSGLKLVGSRSTSSSAGTTSAVPKIEDDEMRKKVVNTLEEFVQVELESEMLDYLKNLSPQVKNEKKFKDYIVEACSNSIIEKGEKERNAIPKALKILHREKFVTEENFNAAFTDLIEFLPDIKIDVPLTDKHFGNYLAQLCLDVVISLENVPQYLEKLRTVDFTCFKTIIGTMLNKLSSTDEGGDMVKAANLDLKQLLEGIGDEAEQKAFVEKYELQGIFAVSPPD